MWEANNVEAINLRMITQLPNCSWPMLLARTRDKLDSRSKAVICWLKRFQICQMSTLGLSSEPYPAASWVVELVARVESVNARDLCGSTCPCSTCISPGISAW
ncbi:hypothetical protein ABW21_db0201049 [Orbilia brochopaga]|nr:hypothetical protein ABW21_db0201049 [Drechslerella brochopaga]